MDMRKYEGNMKDTGGEKEILIQFKKSILGLLEKSKIMEM